MTLPSAGLAVTVSCGTASACVPPVLVRSTVQAALAEAAGQATATGLVSAKAAAITEGVLKSMFLNKIKFAAIVAVVGVLFAGGAGLLVLPGSGHKGFPLSASASAAPAPDKKDDRKEPAYEARILVVVEVKDGKLKHYNGTIQVGGDEYEWIELPKDAKVHIDAKEVKLDDLKTKLLDTSKGSPRAFPALLLKTKDGKSALVFTHHFGIFGYRHPIHHKGWKPETVGSVDEKKSQVVISSPDQSGENAGQPTDRPATVTKETRYFVDGKEAKIGDLKAGMEVLVVCHSSSRHGRLPATAVVIWATTPAKKVGALSRAEFERLRKILQPPNEPWATVAWHSSLTEARTKAQREKKPLLIRCSYGTLHGVC